MYSPKAARSRRPVPDLGGRRATHPVVADIPAFPNSTVRFSIPRSGTTSSTLRAKSRLIGTAPARSRCCPSWSRSPARCSSISARPRGSNRESTSPSPWPSSGVRFVPGLRGRCGRRRTPPWTVERSRWRAAGTDERRGLDVQGQHAPVHQGSRAALDRRRTTSPLQANPDLGELDQAVAIPKTEVITDGIERVTTKGIVTVDGTERDVDAIVCATGFHVTDWYASSKSRARAARTSVIDGIARVGWPIAASPSPRCPICSFCSGRHRLGTTRWCS